MNEAVWFRNPDRSSKGSATHALIVGSSHYPYLRDTPDHPKNETFGLDELTSTATGAYRFADWLRKEYLKESLDRREEPVVPLASIRLLLSPTPKEMVNLGLAKEDFDDKTGTIQRATFPEVERTVLAWYDDCNRRSRDVAILYVSGHGILDGHQITRVLLEDFAETKRCLDGSLDLRNIHEALDYADARKQFVFVNACKTEPIPSKYKNPDVLGGRPIIVYESKTYRDPINRCTIYSTRDGDPAYETGDEFGTVFSRALLECLGRFALREHGIHGWSVAVKDLVEPLQRRTLDIANYKKKVQYVQADTSKCLFKTNFHYTSRPPQIPFHLEIDPTLVIRVAHAKLRNLKHKKSVLDSPLPANPYDSTVQPGPYTLSFDVDGAVSSLTADQKKELAPYLPVASAPSGVCRLKFTADSASSDPPHTEIYLPIEADKDCNETLHFVPFE